MAEPQSEEIIAARKARRRVYMKAYRARKRDERRPRTETDDVIVAVDLLAMLEQMLKARAHAG